MSKKPVPVQSEKDRRTIIKIGRVKIRRRFHKATKAIEPKKGKGTKYHRSKEKEKIRKELKEGR